MARRWPGKSSRLAAVSAEPKDLGTWRCFTCPSGNARYMETGRHEAFPLVEATRHVGRYRWRVTGQKLHLGAIGEDPCNGRAAAVANTTFERVG